MEQNWIVVVSNDVTEVSEFYGPFTKVAAERLVEKLDTLFEKKQEAIGKRRADAMPLDGRDPVRVLKHYRS